MRTPIIVKVQRPVTTLPGHADTWLVYDRTRTINATIDGRTAPASTRRVLKDAVYKAYFHAAHDADNRLIIGARAPDQPW